MDTSLPSTSPFFFPSFFSGFIFSVFSFFSFILVVVSPFFHDFSAVPSFLFFTRSPFGMIDFLALDSCSFILFFVFRSFFLILMLCVAIASN